MRNASNTHSNTHFPKQSLWLVKIHMGPTKSCASHINLVEPTWILTSQRECVEKRYEASISLKRYEAIEINQDKNAIAAENWNLSHNFGGNMGSSTH